MKNIEMVYFDYGNTLIYEEISYGPQTLEKIYQTLEEKTLSLEDFYQKFLEKVISYQEEYFSKDRDFLYRNIFAEIFREENLKSDLTFEAMDKIYFDSHARGYPIEGAKELLAYLDEKNIFYGVISNLSLSADNLRQRIKEVLEFM
ncbi:HAD hydrolase-like protein [Neofamilia massiliensis]|uniref:HAD hydrolase-like protein n=1 Tax=Neofamilia massiliensis TaxID=1673724 RepID=UPI0006BB62ED|nr:HAD hydrolase-like protein [Neofamilia massiliensis]